MVATQEELFPTCDPVLTSALLCKGCTLHEKACIGPNAGWVYIIKKCESFDTHLGAVFERKLLVDPYQFYEALGSLSSNTPEDDR